jgi:outer membrane protein assembly factor BamD (BamD/ComL family)
MRIRLLLPLVLAVAATSCSEFNKAVKSTDKDYKYRMAVQYFDKPDYDRAMPLLEELLGLTRGDTLYEPVSYLHAKGYFGMKDYIMAGYYLGNFAKTFPGVHGRRNATSWRPTAITRKARSMNWTRRIPSRPLIRWSFSWCAGRKPH